MERVTKKKRKAKRISAYVVIEYSDGEIHGCTTFPKTKPGKRAAEELMAELIREYEKENDPGDEKLTEEQILEEAQSHSYTHGADGYDIRIQES